MAFTFDNFFTAVKEGITKGVNVDPEDAAVEAAAAESDATSDVEDVDFFMEIDNEEAHVTCDVLNVRQTPSTSKPRIGQLRRGATITVTGVCDDWLQISLQGQTCYVCGKYTDFESPTATVTASALNIRKGPSTDTDKLGLLPNGAEVRVLAKEKGWVKILYGKEIGYISADYLKFDD